MGLLGLRATFSEFRRRRARAALATVGACSLVVAAGTVSIGPAAASVGSDQASIAQLEQQIANDGAHASALVGRYNEVQAHVNALDLQIAHDEKRVSADLAVERAAVATLRRVAVRAYVTGSSMNLPTLQMLGGTSDITKLLEQNQYLGAVNGKQYDALSALQLDQARTQEAQGALRSEQTQANNSLRELASAHDAATAAIASDEAKLTHVKGDLRSLIAAAAARQHAEQLAQERALARAAQAPPSGTADAPPPPSSPTSSPTTPTTSPPPSSPGGYANPLRGVVALDARTHRPGRRLQRFRSGVRDR